MEDFVDLPYSRKPLKFGIGKTLAEAAFYRGYWNESDERYVCKACRNKDGEEHRGFVLRESRGLPRDSFMRSLTNISKGYVATDELGLECEAIVQKWLELKLPTENLKRSRLVRPKRTYLIDIVSFRINKRWHDAKYTDILTTGWLFPYTIWADNTDYHGNAVRGPSVDTILTLEGHVFSNVPDSVRNPQIDPRRLMVEMARKYLQATASTVGGAGGELRSAYPQSLTILAHTGRCVFSQRPVWAF